MIAVERLHCPVQADAAKKKQLHGASSSLQLAALINSVGQEIAAESVPISARKGRTNAGGEGRSAPRSGFAIAGSCPIDYGSNDISEYRILPELCSSTQSKHASQQQQ